MSDVIRAAVHEQVEQKIAAGEGLEAAIARESQARASLEEAERDVQAARREAVRSGWTETELRKLGLAEPAKRRSTRATAKPRGEANAADQR